MYGLISILASKSGTIPIAEMKEATAPPMPPQRAAFPNHPADRRGVSPGRVEVLVSVACVI
jgi:hypothetical protein